MWSSPKRSRVHAGADDATDERALTLLYTSWGEEQEERLCDASPGDWTRWKGVTLQRGGGAPGRVAALALRGRDLEGLFPAPALLGRLGALAALDLSDNCLTGELPAALPPTLRTLELGQNRFRGALPAAWGDALGELRELRAASSGLDGPIPPSFRRLARLEILDLSRNRLSGLIPDLADGCARLARLDLTGNRLTGPVPLGLLRWQLVPPTLRDGASARRARSRR